MMTHYSSYGSNGAACGSNDFGMAQRPFGTVHEPSKTALEGEISGGIGISWHDPIETMLARGNSVSTLTSQYLQHTPKCSFFSSKLTNCVHQNVHQKD